MPDEELRTGAGRPVGAPRGRVDPHPGLPDRQILHVLVVAQPPPGPPAAGIPFRVLPEHLLPDRLADLGA
jgi:hypothetical protein